MVTEFFFEIQKISKARGPVCSSRCDSWRKGRQRPRPMRDSNPPHLDPFLPLPPLAPDVEHPEGERASAAVLARNLHLELNLLDIRCPATAVQDVLCGSVIRKIQNSALFFCPSKKLRNKDGQHSMKVKVNNAPAHWGRSPAASRR